MKFFDHEPLLLLQSYKTRLKSAHTHSHTCALTVSNATKLHTNLSKPIIWLLSSEFINFYQIFLIFLGEKLLLLIIFETLYLVKMGQIFVTTTLLIKNTDLSFKLTWSLLGKNLLDSIKVDFSSNISTYIY